MSKSISPTSDHAFIDSANINDAKIFPHFLKSLKLNPFRHIPELEVEFQHPISVISGTNRSGKSTILMALACSHFDFKKRNIRNGKLERQTWSNLMKFTSHDKQDLDWTYFITYKWGNKVESKRGQRNRGTKKWNGIGKKESQFKGRQVVFIDLDRIMPARNFGSAIFSLAQAATLSSISTSKVKEINGYISYVLEETFQLSKITAHQDKDIFKYKNTNEYSSYNAATGEEVLTKIIIDCAEAPEKSLILIDELEVGLHPKVQRRLIDVLYNMARNENKQFIITTHSPSVLSSVPNQARIFIDKKMDGTYKSIPNISVNAALSKMDSIFYPLIDLYCEDREAKKIIRKAIISIQQKNNYPNYKDLINIIESGSGDKTFRNFQSHKETYSDKVIKTGFACILDGDRKVLKTKEGNPLYVPEECLHFIYSTEAPEKFLVREYLNKHSNTNLAYHLANTNNHVLFEKMVELSLASSVDDAFEVCWQIFIKTGHGKIYFKDLCMFLEKMISKFSPDL